MARPVGPLAAASSRAISASRTVARPVARKWPRARPRSDWGPGTDCREGDGQERRAGERVAGAEQRVAEAARVVLRHELELERTLVAAGGGLEHRLVRVGDDDGAEEAGVGGFVEAPSGALGRRPTGSDFLGQPAGDRMKAGTETAAGDHRGIQRHASILHAMPSEPSPRPKGEQGRDGWTTADLLSAVRIPLAIAFPFVVERRAPGAAGRGRRERSARRPARAPVRQLGARGGDRPRGRQAVHGVGVRRRGVERPARVVRDPRRAAARPGGDDRVRRHLRLPPAARDPGPGRAARR